MRQTAAIVLALALATAAAAVQANTYVDGQGNKVFEKTVATRCFAAGTAAASVYAMQQNGYSLEDASYLLSPVDKAINRRVAEAIYKDPDAIDSQKAAVKLGREVCKNALNLPSNTITKVKVNAIEWRCFGAGGFAEMARQMRDAGASRDDLALSVPPDDSVIDLPVLDHIYTHSDIDTLLSAVHAGRTVCRKVLAR